MASTYLILQLILLFANHVLCWGGLGHRTVGYLALQYMGPDAIQLFNKIIEPNARFDISDAAIWADQHRRGEWAYTYNWHFIDARDDPDRGVCNVKYTRDCDFRGECNDHKEPGCVVSAIANSVCFPISA
jgi:hypothetical protein